MFPPCRHSIKGAFEPGNETARIDTGTLCDAEWFDENSPALDWTRVSGSSLTRRLSVFICVHRRLNPLCAHVPAGHTCAHPSRCTRPSHSLRMDVYSICDLA